MKQVIFVLHVLTIVFSVITILYCIGIHRTINEAPTYVDGGAEEWEAQYKEGDEIPTIHLESEASPTFTSVTLNSGQLIGDGSTIITEPQSISTSPVITWIPLTISGNGRLAVPANNVLTVKIVD